MQLDFTPCSLEFSELQGLFHVEEMKYYKREKVHSNWYLVDSNVPCYLAESFWDFMQIKYCNGRKNPSYPPLVIVKAEWSLFKLLQEKKHRRKLTGY